jgi:hypothetical protein
MPSRGRHLKFDEYLKEKGIISNDVYTNKVHSRMDRDVNYWGLRHREIDFFNGEEGIREWLRTFQHLAYQETLTDYLRVCLGHLCLDDIASRREYFDENDLINRAYRSFIARGYHRKFYRRR